mmetsp:Transcript_12366/g.18539  ORF Transcript_12366/g.18539 Transcript_12366/m.18539 type:complete len:177 (-) Transcript_12366:85-615(-)
MFGTKQVLTICAAALVGAVVAAEVDSVAFGGNFQRLVDDARVEAKDNGACWKNIEYRGMGSLRKNCTNDEERQAGFCFKKCPDGAAEGFGPICLEPCPSNYEISAGALCCKDNKACTAEVVDIGFKIPLDIIRAIRDEANPIAELKDLKELVHDVVSGHFQECSEAPPLAESGSKP